MELHEFKAKRLLSRYAIRSPDGRVAVTPDEAEIAARDLGSEAVFVKAQIHAGDRAKAGGVRMAGTPAAAKAIAKELLGQKLVTSQTGADGHAVKRVLVEAAIQGGKEFYLAMMVDALSGSIKLIGGAGGTNIEEKIAKGSSALEILQLGLKGERKAGGIANFCRGVGLSNERADKFREVISKIHRAFVELDASLIEINPLVFTDAGDFIALDAKIVLDDNALFRHPDLAELREEDEIDEVELKAQQHQINFMQMGGDIGVVVNGAGLGLATLDLVHAAGGSPANFMDIRTTAKSLDIAHGIGLVLDNPRVKVLFVNVFGGGMQPCDTIIEGLGIAFRRKGRELPMVLRVAGNNEDFANVRLESFGLPKVQSPDMWQAATRAVAIAQGRA
jgi:succinyl-CoA synthetase beta subunit